MNGLTLLRALTVFSGTAGNRMCSGGEGRGRDERTTRGQRDGWEETCTSSLRGMYPDSAKDSFISRSRVSLSERSGGQSESRGPEVLSGPVHSIARHKWQPKLGRETRARG